MTDLTATFTVEISQVTVTLTELRFRCYNLGDKLGETRSHHGQHGVVPVSGAYGVGYAKPIAFMKGERKCRRANRAWLTLPMP